MKSPHFFRHFTLKTKLMLIMMLTSAMGLLLAGIFFGVFEHYRVRNSMAGDMVLLARLVGDRSTAALQFDDQQVAQENLGAFRLKPTVTKACIYDINGQRFASYSANHAAELFPKCEEGMVRRFQEKSFVLFEPILFKGETVGTIFVQANLDEIIALNRSFLLFSGIVIFISILVVLYLSAGLQSFVSIPLLNIANTAQHVTQKKDFSVRVQATPSDDKQLNLLVNAINEMLETIETQNKELIEVNHTLEKRVAERTEQLEIAKDRAEEADRLKSAFLATMSHELRTPLNSIIGFNGILLQGLSGPVNPEQAKQMNMVRESATHLLSLISDVLDISKIEAGQLRVEQKEFSYRDSIQAVIQSIRPLAEKKNLALDVSLAGDVSTICSDKRRIEQILLNLLSNAVKFTDAGSIKVTCKIVGDTCMTQVSDTGMGIAKDDLDKLFRPFRQIDSGITRSYEGTGLGLFICKRLTEMLGGSISVTSEVGKGTSFTYRIPYPSPAAVALKTPMVEPAANKG